MEGIIKMVLLVLIVIYVLSPVDLCPGPIDDIIVVSQNNRTVRVA